MGLLCSLTVVFILLPVNNRQYLEFMLEKDQIHSWKVIWFDKQS